MFPEKVIFSCKHYSFDRRTNPAKLVCTAYPDGVPEKAPCRQIYDVLMKHDPIPPCPNGVHYEMHEKYRERCQIYLDAQEGRRSWDGVPM